MYHEFSCELHDTSIEAGLHQRLMSKRSVTIALAGGALGLLTGYLASPASIPGGSVQSDPASSPSSSLANRSDLPGQDRPSSAATKLRSHETLDSLIAQGEDPTYASLALWLVDASAEDIAAYWDFRKDGNLQNDKMRLIFFNWTRLDPEAAIAAVKGTDKAAYPWWAWAAHDPRAALAASTPEMLADVALGIGEFHPAWVREHFDLIPEEVRKNAIHGVLTWGENSDPRANLDFLKTQGYDANPYQFKTLARQDPLAAFEWLKENGHLNRSNHYLLDTLLETLKTGHPDDLEAIASTTPSGALKRKLEDALFSNLLASDPEEALKQAKAMDAPLVAAKRMAEVGAALLESDPDHAYQIAADIVTANPNKLRFEKLIRGDQASMGWGYDDAATEFITSLLTKDPARTLDLFKSAGIPTSQTFNQLANQWAQRDVEAYAGWVNQQDDPSAWTAASRQVVNQLSTEGRFDEAAEWALSEKNTNDSNLYVFLSTWQRSDSAAASSWLESANLPEPTREKLRTFIKHQP
jgi:hypothetical protein